MILPTHPFCDSLTFPVRKKDLTERLRGIRADGAVRIRGEERGDGYGCAVQRWALMAPRRITAAEHPLTQLCSHLNVGPIESQCHAGLGTLHSKSRAWNPGPQQSVLPEGIYIPQRISRVCAGATRARGAQRGRGTASASAKHSPAKPRPCEDGKRFLPRRRQAAESSSPGRTHGSLTPSVPLSGGSP